MKKRVIFLMACLGLEIFWKIRDHQLAKRDGDGDGLGLIPRLILIRI